MNSVFNGVIMTWPVIKNKKKLAIILSIIVICLIPCFWYFIEVKPHVDKEINSFEENISHIKDPRLRIKAIADFTENNYYQTYGKNPNYTVLFFQIFDDPNKLRIRSSIFSVDPYLIAYFKTGACGESALLFNFYANKSGFESRIVGTLAEDHQWNEIQINDRWVQVDPTIYYYYYNDPETYPTYIDLWLDNPQAYTTLGWYGGYSTVSVFGTNEDLTAKYCNSSKLTIFCQNCDTIKIKSDNGRTFSLDQSMVNSEATFILGKKNYSIIADKTVIPFLLVSEKNANISLEHDENINITSNSERIQSTIYSQILFIIGFFALLFGIVLFYFKMGLKIYKNWKNKQE
jgi:hypothetical protein